MSELIFDAVAHRYTLAGHVLPSVTTVLKPLYDFRFVDPGVLMAKAEIGTFVHRAAELLDLNDLDDESEEGKQALESIAGYLEGYKRFKRDMKPVVIENETRLYHPLHKYAGTIDRRYEIAGEVWDIDLKSTVAMSPVVGIQTAAYTEMFKAHGNKQKARRGALQLFADAKYKLWEFKDPGDFSVFLSLLTVMRFKERHAL